MFTSEMRESRQQEIEMFDVKAPALDALITFCYCGKIQIDGINVASILHAACLLQLDEVQLLEHVRLPLCRPEFLVNTVSKNALVMTDGTCHNLVDQAKNDLILQFSTLKCPQMKRRRTRGCKVVTEVIYVVGGMDERSVECLDPESTNRVWQYVAPLKQEREFTGVAAFEKIIYAVGGRDLTTVINNNERYNAATDQWTSDVAPCPSDRCSFSVAGLEHHFYVVGGSECSP
ncbi:hypothetical protein V3C99_000954, partial [Haemonchus contortus]